jgi:hypothetical protein
MRRDDVSVAKLIDYAHTGSAWVRSANRPVIFWISLASVRMPGSRFAPPDSRTSRSIPLCRAKAPAAKWRLQLNIPADELPLYGALD